MLSYEDARTKNIVSRLVTIGNTGRMITIAIWVITLGVLFSLLAGPLLGELWWLGGIIGLLLGYMIGVYIASIFTVITEWMAQLLISQGEILAALKNK